MDMVSREELDRFIQNIQGADENAMREAAQYAASLAAPPGSLGKLTEAAVQLAGVTGKCANRIERRRIIVMCADNGVVEEGVCVTPQYVTYVQAVNMTRGLTGMSALARHFGCEVEVVDVGIATPYDASAIGAVGEAPHDASAIGAVGEAPHDASGADAVGEAPILQRRIRRGTRNMHKGPALTTEETLQAIGVGIERARKAADDGVDVIGIGEMGIGNTTTSSAVLAALTGLDTELVTGRGAGLTDEAFLRKKEVIRRALELHHLARWKGGRSGAAERVTEFGGAVTAPRPEADCIDILARVGGLDLAAMCGVYLGAAAFRIPVVIDGFISIVAALCAVRLCPKSRDFMFPSHASVETGYMRAADEIGLAPWLHLGMRLGEGSGCPLAIQILEAACVLMNDMATFEKASIDDGYLDEIRSRQ